MRRLILDTLLSLDGYFAGLGNEIDWFLFDEESLEWSRKVLRTADTVLFGRVTYELMTEYWPTAAALAEEPYIARRLTELPKIVFSRTLKNAGWANTTVRSGSPEKAVAELKAQMGGDIVVLGSSSVVSLLLREGLVDEVKIRIQPMVLGKGRPLFAGLTKRHPLRLLRARTFKSGVVALHYEVVK